MLINRTKSWFFNTLLLLLLASLLPIGEGFSQGFSNYNWYFGSTDAGINFSKASTLPNLVSDQGLPFGTERSAVATDPSSGELLFYTDGNLVFDASHTAMPGGPIPGTEKPVVVCEVPGVPDQYFIITNDATGPTAGNISFSIVDMSLPGNSGGAVPLGEVTSTLTASGLNNTSEAMLVVAKENGIGFWLIYKQSGNNNNYEVSSIDGAGAAGFQAPTTFALSDPLVAGSLKYNRNTDKIAVVPQTIGRNVQILDFDPVTGILTFDTDVQFSGGAATNASFDAEWSVSGNKLYISKQDPDHDLVQYDIGLPSGSLVSVLPASVDQSLGLRRGPDNTLYHLYEAGGNVLLGRVNEPDSIPSLVNYDADPFFGTVFNATRLPNIAAFNPPVTVDFNPKTACNNLSVNYIPSITNTLTGDPISPDSLLWEFSDGTTSTHIVPIHTFMDDGSGPPASITLTAFVGGIPHRTTSPITIDPYNLQINLVNDTTICALPFSVTAENTTGASSLIWNNGQVGPTLDLSVTDSVGLYYLTATDGSCAGIYPITIRLYRQENQRANVWFFGNQAGIDFNGFPTNPAIGIPVPSGILTLNNEIISPEGTSIISDANGDPIFYTDGNNVWDRRGGAPIATGIGGDNTSAQSALIVQVPQNGSQYYIFTTQPMDGASTDFELNYSIFDLAQNAGFGAVVEQGHLLFATSTERIAANDDWLIAHELGTNTFRSYPLTPDGIGAPVLSSVGAVHSKFTTSDGQGYMKLSNNGQLAVAFNNTVELFDFDNASGLIFNELSLDFAEAGQAYGVEFSPSGRNLYATLRNGGGGGKLFIWEVDSTTALTTSTSPVHIAASRQEIPISGNFGALQVGPDGILYIAEDGATDLQTVTDPDIDFLPDPTDNSIVVFPTTSSISLAGQTSGLGLPSFVQTLSEPITDPTFDFSDNCVDQVVSFTATNTYDGEELDNFNWSVEDDMGTVVITSTERDFEHTFDRPGDYTVRLTIVNDCTDPTTGAPYTFTFDPETLRIFPFPAEPISLNTTETFCDGTPLTLDADNNEAGVEYVWEFDGAVINDDISDSDIEPTETGTYFYSLTSANGCVVRDSVVVSPAAEYTLNEPGPLCKDEDFTLIPTPAIAGDYTWTISNDGGVTFTTLSRTQDQDIDTSIPGDYIYRLTVLPTINPTCPVSEEVEVTVNPSAEFTLTPGSASGTCTSPNGSITIDISSTGSYAYAVDLGGSIVANDVNILGASSATNPPVVVSGLVSGAYQVTLTNEATGCEELQVVTVNNTAADFEVNVMPFVQLDCDLVQLEIEVAPLDPLAPPESIYPITYALINEDTGEEFTGNFTSPRILPSSFRIEAPLEDGNYLLDVIQDATGCNVGTDPSTPIVINKDVPELVAIGPTTITLCPGNVARLEIQTTPLSDSVKVNWTGPENTSGVAKFDVSTPGIYFAELSNASGTCISSEEFVVVFEDPFTVDFIAPDICGDVSLTAFTDLSGSFSYTWFRDGANFGVGEEIAVTENGAYRVEAVNTVSGCLPASTSDEKDVTIVPEFSVSILPVTPCSGGDFEVEADIIGANDDPLDYTFAWTINGRVQTGAIENIFTVESDADAFDISVIAISNDRNICQAFDNVIVERKDGAPSPFARSYNICPADPTPAFSELTLPATAEELDAIIRNFSSVAWTNTSGGPDPIVEPDGFTVNITDPGDYEVRLSDFKGCSFTQRVVIKEDCRPRIDAPNAFAPNGNNKTFSVFPVFVSNFEIFIYSRWGEIVFQSNDPNFIWDGSFAGKAMPAGTYPYVIKYADEFNPDTELEQRGGVLLIR